MHDTPFFDTFNAKHKSDAEIASTFVLPPSSLGKLLTKDHAILSGPRGSGKTTLLKMMTIPALQSWREAEAEPIQESVDFLSVFVAADRSWHGQLKRLSKQIPEGQAAELLGMSAFTTHIFKAIVSACIDWQRLPRDGNPFYSALLPKLDIEAESKICEIVADLWMLQPRAYTFYELRASLTNRLGKIGLLRNRLKFGVNILSERENEYLFIDYREGIKGAAEAHNQVSGLHDRRWSFLFDEMEVAPSFIQESLFSDLRGKIDRLKYNYKLALAPFNKNFRSIFDEHSAASSHDYVHIDLTFARKESGYEFSKKLIAKMIAEADVEGDDENLLGRSHFSFEDDEDEQANPTNSKYSANRPLGDVFAKLSEKDSSFRSYLAKRSIHLDDLSELDENLMAMTLRKIRNIVVVREHFSRPSKSGINAERLTSRSRKTYALYSGSPSMLALTEGNPRSVINLISPLVAEFAEKGARGKVGRNRQAAEIQRTLRIMRSLLKTVPYKGARQPGRGLLPFLDKIGEALYREVLATRFNQQPPLSFRVDHGVSNDDLAAIGKALNLGALVYVPDIESEDIISSVKGKRFRLNYTLAAYYKLPLSLDREVSLSKLLGRLAQDQQSEMELRNDD
ncbi:MAG: hypothetical protein V2I43_10455 [Parvularcula sp.]|jgi:hypothetical protein|nr:hypothetical protein [Parvularcula sp.]